MKRRLHHSTTSDCLVVIYTSFILSPWFFRAQCNLKQNSAHAALRGAKGDDASDTKCLPVQGAIGEVHQPHIEPLPVSYTSTLQGINISHLGKRKIIFKMPFLGDMLVSWRVFFTSTYRRYNPIVTHLKAAKTQNVPKQIGGRMRIKSSHHRLPTTNKQHTWDSPFLTIRA